MCALLFRGCFLPVYCNLYFGKGGRGRLGGGPGQGGSCDGRWAGIVSDEFEMLAVWEFLKWFKYAVTLMVTIAKGDYGE